MPEASEEAKQVDLVEHPSINHQSSPSVNYQQEKEQVSGFTTARDKDIMDKLAKRKNLYGSNANNNRKNNGGYNNFNNYNNQKIYWSWMIVQLHQLKI